MRARRVWAEGVPKEMTDVLLTFWLLYPRLRLGVTG